MRKGKLEFDSGTFLSSQVPVPFFLVLPLRDAA